MNHMVYISKTIQDRFKDEPNKSGLINRLLSDHYSLQAPTQGFSEVPVKIPGSAPLPNLPGFSIFERPASEMCPHHLPLATCPDIRCSKKARNKGTL